MANATSRRALAGGAVLAMIGGTAALAQRSATTDDDELIRLCGDFCRLEREYQRLITSCSTPDAEDAAEPVIERIVEQQQPLLAQICAKPAVTREGMAAIAASRLLWDGELFVDEDDPNADTSDRLQAALLRSRLSGGKA